MAFYGNTFFYPFLDQRIYEFKIESTGMKCIMAPEQIQVAVAGKRNEEYVYIQRWLRNIWFTVRIINVNRRHNRKLIAPSNPYFSYYLPFGRQNNIAMLLLVHKRGLMCQFGVTWLQLGRWADAIGERFTGQDAMKTAYHFTMQKMNYEWYPPSWFTFTAISRPAGLHVCYV